MKNKWNGFTIVELLVVIVVIGILAAITIVSYNGVTTRANIAMLQSDLNNSSKKLGLFNVDNDIYPTTLGTDGCPTTPITDSTNCLKVSSGTTLSYYGNSKGYLVMTNRAGLTYRYYSEDGLIQAVNGPTVPYVNANTLSAVSSTSAILGASILYDGGSAVTSYGTCWGTLPKPTTNCLATSEFGLLASLAPDTISTGGAGGPYGINLSSDGKSVYVARYASIYNDIAMFSRDVSTGLLTNIGYVAAGTNPRDIVVSNDGTSAYAVAPGNDYMYIYTRNTSTGVLTPYSSFRIWGSAVLAVSMSNDSKSVYTTDYNDNVVRMYSRNTSNGALTSLGSIPTMNNPYNIVISNDGASAYVINSGSGTVSMYDRNISTGVLTAKTTPTIAGGGWGIAISPDDKSVYIGAGSIIQMYSRNTSTGYLTALAPASVATAGNVYDLVVSPDNGSVYAANSTTNNISMFSRNSANGNLTPLSTPTISTGALPWGIAISPDGGNSVYTSNYNNSTVSMFSRSTTINGTTFTQPRVGLPSNTQIYFIGYATNSIGTGYSSDGSFKTLP